MQTHATVRMPIPKRASGSVLIVEDDEHLSRSLARVISAEGYRVVQAATSAAAIDAVLAGSFDVVLSDVNLPGASGMDVLNVVRAYDPDVPLLLMTGAPDTETAIEAVNLGVLEFIVKPASRERIVEAVSRASIARRIASNRKEAETLSPPASEATVPSSRMTEQVERAFATLFVDLEPVVDARHRVVLGYEARLGSREEALATQPALVVAAERVGRLEELRRRGRDLAVKAFVSMPSLSALFVDVHASDLLDHDLYSPDSPLSRVADRVVLQLRARGAALSMEDLFPRASVLRYMGFRLAVADLDGGGARLAHIAELAPSFVKIEADLVRRVHDSPTRQRVVAAMAAMCKTLGAATIAEGVVTAEERDALLDAGVDALQGPLVAPLAPNSVTRRTPVPVR